jgi:hypothetical protein
VKNAIIRWFIIATKNDFFTSVTMHRIARNLVPESVGTPHEAYEKHLSLDAGSPFGADSVGDSAGLL